MIDLDYQRAPKDGATLSEGRAFLLATPGFLMGTLGWVGVCAGMLSDDPKTKVGPLFAAALDLLMLTGPIGLVTVLVSIPRARKVDRRWIWLNWIVPPAHFAVAFALLWLSQL